MENIWLVIFGVITPSGQLFAAMKLQTVYSCKNTQCDVLECFNPKPFLCLKLILLTGYLRLWKRNARVLRNYFRFALRWSVVFSLWMYTYLRMTKWKCNSASHQNMPNQWAWFSYRIPANMISPFTYYVVYTWKLGTATCYVILQPFSLVSTVQVFQVLDMASSKTPCMGDRAVLRNLPALCSLYIYLLTAIGLTPGGSSTVHIYTLTMHRTTQLIWEECGPCPVSASYTLAFALQLRKMHGKTSVRVAEECQLARWKQKTQNRTYITEQNIRLVLQLYASLGRLYCRFKFN
jgi:hypothetical protein